MYLVQSMVARAPARAHCCALFTSFPRCALNSCFSMRLSAHTTLGPTPLLMFLLQNRARPGCAWQGSAACSAAVFRQGRHALRASGRTLQGQTDPPARPQGVVGTCV